MRRRKVLYVLHNHPIVRTGGAEVYALELYEAMQSSEAFEPFLLARAETRVSRMTSLGPATPGDPRQYLIHTRRADFDHFIGSSRRASDRRSFIRFLGALRPDIVHFQHTLFLGYDLVSDVRRTLPSAAIVYTLHDFHPICHREGQMVRTRTNELCDRASPKRCHGCFPEISPKLFAERKRFVTRHLDLVDLFIAPSKFLRDRYVAWHVPGDKIVVEDYGRLPSVRVPETLRPPPRNRLGFFGQITPFKGVEVLLEAMKLLKHQNVPVYLWIHGANLEFAGYQYRRLIETLFAETRENVTVVERYEARDLQRLMTQIDWVVVPSIWWENSPLVIQEAFGHGRPVICSAIGGMAEKVSNGVDGIHFRAGDPAALARAIENAVAEPALWDALRTRIRPVPAMTDHLERLEVVYGRLLRRKRTHAA